MQVEKPESRKKQKQRPERMPEKPLQAKLKPLSLRPMQEVKEAQRKEEATTTTWVSQRVRAVARMSGSAVYCGLRMFVAFELEGPSPTLRPQARRPEHTQLESERAAHTTRYGALGYPEAQSSSFLGLPYRILYMNLKKELLWGLWVDYGSAHKTKTQQDLTSSNGIQPCSQPSVRLCLRKQGRPMFYGKVEIPICGPDSSRMGQGLPPCLQNL